MSFDAVTISPARSSDWISIDNQGLALRCWWAAAEPRERDIDPISIHKRAYVVLPEVFGVNAWVRNVAERLAAQGIPALAVPLFARTAPDLDLDYSDSALAEGRRHKDATTTPQILSDLSAAVAWLQQRCPAAAIDVVGFCFGGHATWLAATLPEVTRSFAFYGAGVVQGRPGGGAPTLELLPQVSGAFTCLFGFEDPLIPASDRAAIEAALHAADPAGRRLRAVSYAGADHGFMCDARAAFHDKAASAGWRLLKDALGLD